jgi:colicin import membrane protein
MRPLISTCFLMVVSFYWGGCLGQEVTSPLDVGAERLRVSELRAEQEANYQRQQQACYQRFSVNDCLIQARRERREVLDELRRRDLLLNELERQTQAINAINRIQDKLSPERQQQLADHAEQARQETRDRQARNDEKNAKRANVPITLTPLTLENVTTMSASESAQFERAYLDKLAEAQKRKADLEKRLRQKGKTADSLPVPN